MVLLLYLEGAEAQLYAETQAQVGIIRQEVEHHVMSPKQRDEEKSGLGQASVEEESFIVIPAVHTHTHQLQLLVHCTILLCLLFNILMFFKFNLQYICIYLILYLLCIYVIHIFTLFL